MDAATGRINDTWQVKGLNVCGFAPEGPLAILTDRVSLQLWDLRTRKQIRRLDYQGQLKHPPDASFAPDAKIVATTMSSQMPGHLTLGWDVATGRKLWEIGHLGAPDGWMVMAGFLPDGKSMVFRDWSNNRISVHDRITAKVLHSFATMPPERESRCSGLSPDGKAYLMGTAGGSVRVWDIATGEERPALDGHKQPVHQFAFRRDSGKLLTYAGDRRVLVWDWPAGKPRQTIDFGVGRSVDQLEFSADGKRAQITAWAENAPRWFDLETAKEVPRPAEAHNGEIKGIAIAPDGRLVSAGYDNTYRVWDLDTGRQLHQFPLGHRLGAEALSLSADGRLVATGNGSGPILVHERDTGRLVRSIVTEPVGLIHVAFSPAGQRLLAIGEVSPGSAGQIRLQHFTLWDTVTWKQVRRLEGAGPVFSSDGRWLAGTVSDQATLWDVRDRPRTGTPREQRIW